MLTKDIIVRAGYEVKNSDARIFLAQMSSLLDKEKKAVDDLFNDCDYYGLNYVNFYPLIGRTSANTRFDAKLANNITWNNGVSGYYAPKGVKGDAFAFYGDTGKLSNSLTQTSCGLMAYACVPYLTSGLVAIGASNSGNSQMCEISTGTTMRSRLSNNSDAQGRLSYVPSSAFKGLVSNYRFSASSHKIYENGTEVASATTNGGANPAFSIYTHARNINNASQGWNPGIFAAFGIKATGWTAQNHADEATVMNRFVTTLNRVAYDTVADVNVLFDGDSITTTVYSDWTNIYLPDSFATKYFAVPNVAVAGQKTADVLSDQVAQLTANYAAGKINIYNILIGTNDICAGVTVNTITANLQTIINNARNAGYYICMCTILPRSAPACGAVVDGTFESKRQQVNAWIRTSNADMVCDIGNDPTIGQFGDSDNTTYYSDQTHPTQAGGKIIAMNHVGTHTQFLYAA